MSYRKAELSKYLSQYSRQSTELEDMFVETKRSFIVKDPLENVGPEIERLERNIVNQLNSNSIRNLLQNALGNTQQLWDEHSTERTVVQPIETASYENELLSEEARKLRSVSLRIDIELVELRVIQYNLPLLESCEQVSVYNTALPDELTFLFFVFGERKQTELLRRNGSELVNAALSKIHMRNHGKLQFSINFAESHLPFAEEVFTHSQVEVVCVDSDGLVQATGSCSACELLLKDEITINMHKVWDKGFLKLVCRIDRQEKEVVRSAHEKLSLLNDRLVSVPEDRVLQLKLQTLKTRSDHQVRVKRSEYLQNQHHEPSEEDRQLQIIQQYREQTKHIKNAALLQSIKSERIVEMFSGMTMLLPVALANLDKDSKKIRLQFLVQENPDKLLTKEIKFVVTQEQYDAARSQQTGWKPDLVFTPFSELQITDKIWLTMPAGRRLTVLLYARFEQQGYLRLTICNQPHAFLVSSYQTPSFRELTSSEELKDTAELISFVGIKHFHDGSKVHFKRETAKVTSGYWHKLLVVPAARSIPLDKFDVKVRPIDNHSNYRHSAKHLEVGVRCFSDQPKAMVVVLLLHEDQLVELIALLLEISPRKTNLSKRLRVQPDQRLYQLDITEFTEANSRYQIKSMKPNYLQILSETVLFGAEAPAAGVVGAKRGARTIHARLVKYLGELEVEIIVYNLETWSSTSVMVLVTTDEPPQGSSSARTPFSSAR